MDGQVFEDWGVIYYQVRYFVVGIDCQIFWGVLFVVVDVDVYMVMWYIQFGQCVGYWGGVGYGVLIEDEGYVEFLGQEWRKGVLLMGLYCQYRLVIIVDSFCF